MHSKSIKYKLYYIIILGILLIGFIIGYLYFNFISSDIKIDIANTIKDYHTWHYNFILKDLIVMSLIIVLAFFIIGIPLGLLYIFYESFSIGFLVKVFIYVYKLKGLLFISIFIIICKLLTLLLKILFVLKVAKCGYLTINSFINKNNYYIKDRINNNFRNSLYLLIIVLIINVILYFISPFILKKISFIL